MTEQRDNPIVTATIGFKTKQKKAFTTFFAEGNTTDTWDAGNPQNRNWIRWLVGYFRIQVLKVSVQIVGFGYSNNRV